MKAGVLVGIVLALTLAACGDGGSSRVSLSTRLGATSAPASAGTVRSALTAGEGVTLTRVQLVIRRVELERVAAVDEGTTSSGAESLRAGPFLLDLSGAALDGGITRAFQVDVEPGTYEELEFRVQKLMGDESVGDALFDERTLSVVVEGTIDADGGPRPFRFTSSLDDTQELEGPFTIEEGSNNVTLSIDPSAWFTVDGATVPFVAGEDDVLVPDESFRSELEANIRASIEAFEDDDADGAED